jgi:hypothetical protein
MASAEVEVIGEQQQQQPQQEVNTVAHPKL